MAAHDFQLYVTMTCPYCARVRRYMAEAGIEIPLHDIQADEEAYQTLKRVGGKTQVPCLFIDGEPMYESLDIIAWLKDNVAGPDAPEFVLEPEGQYETGAACMLRRD